jgi:phosphoglycolate phosphatase
MRSNSSTHKAAVRLLVTDLDNTLYDWVTFFSQAFYEMVGVAARILDVPQEVLLDDLQEVHQRYGDSEHPFALLEARATRRKYPDLSRPELAKVLDDAFHSFNRSRVRFLALYPGVAATLHQLHGQGVLIAGHTEAASVNAVFRLKKLGIEHYFTRLYAREPAEHDPSDSPRPAFLEDGMSVAYLPREERKPNPRVVVDICRGMGVPPSQTLYVGDSLIRDIGMAKEAGAWAAWPSTASITTRPIGPGWCASPIGPPMTWPAPRRPRSDTPGSCRTPCSRRASRKSSTISLSRSMLQR